MLFLVKLISAFMIVSGSIIAVRAGYLRRMLEYVREGKRIYVCGIMRLVLGTILLIGSPYCIIEWWVAFIGLLLIWSALIIFLMKLSALREIINWWLRKDDKYLSIAGGIIAIIGICLLLAA